MNWLSPYQRPDAGARIEHFSGWFVITEKGPAFGPGQYFCTTMRSARSAQGSSRRFAFNKKSNTWKAMITTNAKAECVPGIWNKWRNAYMNSFKRDVVWTRSGEKQPAPKGKDAKAQERRVSS